MYYSLLNSSLSYVLCYMLYVIVCIYISCICACGPRPEMSKLCGEWFLNERISRSCEPCSSPPSLYCAPHCTQRCYCRTANCSRTGHAKRGATCAYLKACSPPHFSTPTALKQHRDQSIRPVSISDSDYSDISQ